jgi:enoyl-CoA hydratase
VIARTNQETWMSTTTSTGDALIATDIDGPVATLTLNRPDRLNALTAEMVDELVAELAAIEQRPDIRAVIVAGAGRGFCAGADVVTASGRPLPIESRYTFFNVLEDHPKPTVAAIHGACIGGGLELALCCDLRIAVDDAKLGFGEVKLGVIPAGGGTARLPRLIGPAKAKELLYFGDHLSGREAAELGIVNRSVPADALLDEAKALAQRLALGAPLAIAAIKRSVNAGMQMGLVEALSYETAVAAEVRRTADALEGITAFAEKRQPSWRGE